MYSRRLINIIHFCRWYWGQHIGHQQEVGPCCIGERKANIEGSMLLIGNSDHEGYFQVWLEVSEYNWSLIFIKFLFTFICSEPLLLSMVKSKCSVCNRGTFSMVRSEPKCSYFVIMDAACTLLRVQRQKLWFHYLKNIRCSGTRF
jgi:hypothetical protein